jgi:membrane dipeptidase
VSGHSKKREEAGAFLASHLVWDNHGCMPLRWNDETFLPQLQRYRAAGVDVVSLNVGFGEQGVEEHLRMLAAFRHWIAERPAEYVLVKSVDDVRRARNEGKLAITFDIEGARGVADQLSLISLYYDLGVRWMLMAYNRRNLVGDGVYDDEEEGLTPYGAEVVAEMERVGMVVCCSHTGPRTALQVMERATRPVIFSHSNPNAVWRHRRNIDDELMRACAATGGVVGINGVGLFLGDLAASSEAFVRHLEYAVETIGPDHVGLGLDYVFDMAELEEYLRTMRHTFPDDATYNTSAKFVAPEQLVDIVALLLEHGFSNGDLAKILGENHLRIANEVWKTPAFAT